MSVIYVFNGEIHLVFLIMSKGLDALISDDCYVFDRGRARRIMYMILSGLDYIHGNIVIHRDLKPVNILIDLHETAKITDFGLALTNIPETISYREPEMMLGFNYNQKVDVWVSIQYILFY